MESAETNAWPAGDTESEYPVAEDIPLLNKDLVAAAATANLYSLLNLQTTANIDEIKAAHKRLSLLYHPDKHQNNAAASKQFQQIQRAYTILVDPNQRLIYDLYGEKGLEHSWELGPRLKSTEEIREEYEARVSTNEKLASKDMIRTQVLYI